MCAGTGPINTWNRAAYMHVGKDGNPTDVPEWTHISQNFIMNGPTIGHTSSLFPFVDNDDGKCKQSPCITVLARQGTRQLYCGCHVCTITCWIGFRIRIFFHRWERWNLRWWQGACISVLLECITQPDHASVRRRHGAYHTRGSFLLPLLLLQWCTLCCALNAVLCHPQNYLGHDKRWARNLM